jgi:hypothetical protein
MPTWCRARRSTSRSRRRTTVIGELLAYVRRGDVEAVHSLRRGAAEALEAVVRGDRKTSKVAGRRIDEIGLPKGAQIGAIVRGLHRPTAARPRPSRRGDHRPPRHGDRAGDHVIVFVPPQAHGARGGEAVPGGRHLPVLSDEFPALAVVALVGRMVVLFALLMLVPLAFAWSATTRASRPSSTASLVTLVAAAWDEPADPALPPRAAAARRLPAGGLTWTRAAGLRRCRCGWPSRA